MEKSGIVEWTRYNCLLRNTLNIPGGRAERTRQLTNLKLSLNVQCSGMSIFTAFTSSLCSSRCFLEKAQLCHRPNKSRVLRLHFCCTHTSLHPETPLSHALIASDSSARCCPQPERGHSPLSSVCSVATYGAAAMSEHILESIETRSNQQ